MTRAKFTQLQTGPNRMEEEIKRVLERLDVRDRKCHGDNSHSNRGSSRRYYENREKNRELKHVKIEKEKKNEIKWERIQRERIKRSESGIGRA